MSERKSNLNLLSANNNNNDRILTDEESKSNANKIIVNSYPSILQITSICFKDSESHIHQAKPTVRCVHDIKIKDLVREVIIKKWKLKSPRIVVLIMSNVGPLHNWTNAKQIKSFQKGLMNAAQNTNMWLITNGIDIGSTHIIGDAVSDYITEAKYKRQTNREKTFSKFNFIGIASEESLKYLSKITDDSDEPEIEIPSESMTYEKNKYRLNENLSHYILIKDKSIDKNGVNAFVSELIQFLSFEQQNERNWTKSKEDFRTIESTEVPVVSLIIKGGYGCARLVFKQIRNQIPVVVLRGSGGLADLLGFVDIEIRERCLNVWNPEFVETYLKPELTIRIIEMFPKLRNNSLLCDQFRHRILESVRQSRKGGQNYLTIINLFDKYSVNLENLTDYMLLALFRSQRTEPVDTVSSHMKGEPEPKPPNELIRKDLNLCVDWNCPEIAKKEVLSKDPTFELSSEKELFMSSLIRPNRWQFVDLFLSQKFKLRTFVTSSRLRKMFRKIHSRDFFLSVCWETILGRSPDSKQTGRFLSREFNWLISACTGIKEFVDQNELKLFEEEEFSLSEKEAERKALALIVFWALFDFRQKLVRILWRHSDQPIHLALIIAMTYQKLSSYTVEEALSIELKEESKLFVTFACDMLDIINKQSAYRAEQVLNESTKDWNYYTAVDLAAFGKFRAFFSLESCQRWLTNQTYGNIIVKDLRYGLFRIPSMFKLLLSAYLVFPSYFWIRLNRHRDVMISRIESKEEVATDSEDYNNKSDSEYMSDTGLKDQQKTPELKKKRNKLGSDMSRMKLQMKEENEQQSNPPIYTIIYEVWTAPITKFWNFQFFYTFYLSVFSAAVLYPRCGLLALDLIVIVWTALIVVDSFRQNYLKYKRNTKYSIVVQTFGIIFQISFILFYIYGRVIDQNNSDIVPYAQKVVMCLALLHAYYVLFTVFLPISATLGPLLYRLRIMILVDFLNFIRLSILVMISFGIVLQAILYPDMSIDLELFRSAFHRALFSMFKSFDGDLLVDEECEDKYRWDKQKQTNGGNQCTASIYSDENCRVTGFWPYFLYVVYYILLKVILMTLLYAIFASSATRLTADTDSIWKFQRYGLVMDFVTRAPLPPPLNIFYYIYWIFRLLFGLCFGCCPKQNTNETFSFFPEIRRLMSTKPFAIKMSKLLADDDYTYLRILASEVYDKYEEKMSSDSLVSQQFERTKANSEELEYQRRTLRQLKGKMSEMERSIRQTYACLELIKHMTTKKLGIDNSGLRTPHVFSRHSPYPNTSTQRFPVPDKYVPWTVVFIDYDPTVYTKSKEEFSSGLQKFVDVDIIPLQSEGSFNKTPVLDYNRLSVSGGGITIDRRSWEETDNERLIYKLDNGIPVNPFGRTGLRGRASLLRWGPNHYVMVVITRDNGNNDLEVLVENPKPQTNQISLIVRFIPSEITYKSIESLFKIEDSENKNWTESKKMIDYFTSFDENNFRQNTESNEQIERISFKYERLLKGYFDDPLNTDQAWKEVELWHFHYFNQTIVLDDSINDPLEWRSVTETFFTVLTLSQSNVIQVIADKLKARIR